MPASFSTVNHKSFLSIRGVRNEDRVFVRTASKWLKKKQEGGGGFIKIIDLAVFLKKKIDSREEQNLFLASKTLHDHFFRVFRNSGQKFV